MSFINCTCLFSCCVFYEKTSAGTSQRSQNRAQPGICLTQSPLNPHCGFHSFTFVYITKKSYGVLIIECQKIWDPHTQTHTWQTTLIGKHTSIRPWTGGKVHSPCAPPCLQVGAAVKGWNCKTNDWILRTGLDGSLIKKKKQKTWDANKESTPNCHMPVYTV